VITFVVISAIMAIAAAIWIARPLITKTTAESNVGRASLIGAAALVVFVPLIAAGLYARQTNWSWNQTAATAAQQGDVEAMVTQLEQRLQQSPDDLQGWLMLGRSYLALERPARAVDAYQKAYDLSKGEETEAVLGLGEALVLTDQSSLQGRAGQLFEQILSREPGNPTALWYGAVTALMSGNLPQARERMANLLAQNPPQQVRDILERQIQDIDQQLGAPAVAAQSKNEDGQDPAKPIRALQVKVSIDPKLASNLDPRTPIFILARDGAGPPLAAVRRAVGDLPFTVTLSDTEAMMAGLNLSSVQQAQIVARISKSGSPQAQQGDLFGEVTHSFANSSAELVNITIDSVVP
jgi:cytochrome c-type biogenesis protein CcmH